MITKPSSIHQNLKKVALTLDNVIQFLGEQGADPETLKLLQQQCAVHSG